MERVTITVTPELMRRARLAMGRVSAEEGRNLTVSEIIRRALSEWLDRHEEREEQDASS